ncbi:hypothetical protein ABPG72_004399 [Tetrahymena utriculariae]
MDTETNSEISSQFFQKQIELYKKIYTGVEQDEIKKQINIYKQIASFQCAAPIKKEEVYFKCLDCSTQPTHCICESCFFAGDHENHSFLYFNKLTGGTCDCGDPNLSQLLLCRKHQKTSQEDKIKYEHIIKPEYKKMINEYFQQEFACIFKKIEQNYDEILTQKKQISSQNEIINQFQMLVDEIKIFITENPSGTLILSKVLMEAIPSFICNHDCDSIDEEQEHFQVISKSKIVEHQCNCSILKNIFRYIKFYGTKLEYEIELTLNHFFINQYFKLKLIQVFCEMFNFMLLNYTEESKLFRLFYQFNSASCYETFLQNTYKRGYLFSSLKKLQIYTQQQDYKEARQKYFFFYFLLYFFTSNEQNPIIWQNNVQCAVQIIKSICQNGKCQNFGAHFIMTRLIQDYLFLQVIQEAFKSLHEMPEESKMKFYGQVLVGMLELIEEFQEQDEKYQKRLECYKKCITLEDEIINLIEKKLQNINKKDFKKNQQIIFNDLENMTLQQIDNYYSSLQKLKQYVEAVQENQYQKNDSEHEVDMQQSEQSKNFEDDSDVDNIDKINFGQITSVQGFFYQSDQNQKPLFSTIYTQEEKQGAAYNKFTSKIKFYEIEQCPLFNNKYRVIGLIFAQIYIQSESFEQAKQKILNLISTYGSESQIANFQKSLLFIIKQLSECFEYVRYHDEKIMGYNDYQALQNEIPGNNADKVPIEKYYMNPDYNLYDNDIMTMQTILIFVEPKLFAKSMLEGMQIQLEDEIIKYDEKIGPFCNDQDLLLKYFKNLKQQQSYGKQPLIIKQVKNFLKVILMLGLDTNSQLNCLHIYKDIFVKWMKPYLRNALNICFNFNKKQTFQTLKEQLTNLKINKQIPVKYSILSVVKLSGDYFERLPDLKFVFEPFDFLRDKKLHNEYYQLLKEQYTNNQEIDYILGNQFETLIVESQFQKEVFDNICQSDQLLCLVYKILTSIGTITYERMFQELIQYSLKYIYCYLYINKVNHNSTIRCQKIAYLVQDQNLIKNLQVLKEEKELFKTIDKIESLIKELRQLIQIELNGQITSKDIEYNNSNYTKEEDERTIFRKRAKEAQLRQLQIMKQKTEKFKENNLNEVGHSINIEYEKQKHVCMYCQDPHSNELQIIQAYIEKDNLDQYTNKQFKIPFDNKFRYIIQSCQHTSHYDCRDKAKLTQRYKLGALVPNGTRRKVEGFCLQCRFLFNIGIPFVEQYLKKTLTLNFENEEKPIVIESKSNFCDIEQLQSKFQKQISLGNSQKELVKDKIMKDVSLFLDNLYINFDEEDDFRKIKILMESLIFNLQQVFEQGMDIFFKKKKLISSNIFLCAKYFIQNTLGQENFEACQQNLKQIIDQNWEILTCQPTFIDRFFTNQQNQKTHCFSDLSDIYLQTCFCIAISEKLDNQAAVKICLLSEVVFFNIVSIHSRILTLKSFTENEISRNEMLEIHQIQTAQGQLQTKPIDNHKYIQMQQENNRSNDYIFIYTQDQQSNSVHSMEQYLNNEEYMSSLMGYIQPWSNLITSTLLTLYYVKDDEILEDLVLSDNRQVDIDSQMYQKQCEMFKFLRIKSEMLVSGIYTFDQFVKLQHKDSELEIEMSPSNLLQNIQYYESIKYNLTELGMDFKENHQRFINKRCSSCNSYPRAAKSDLCICLICGIQICSITCEQKNIFSKENEMLIKTHVGNLNNHAQNCHEGKTIFFNILENVLILIDSPMTIEYDHLYFDLIKQPMKIDIMDYSSARSWSEYSLDKQKLQFYQNLIIQRQIPNKIRSIIQSSTQIIECRHSFL